MADAAWPSEAAFARGDEVQLTGLSKEHLNGARGVVTSYDAERDRFSVQLCGAGSAGRLAVRPLNLALSAPPAAEAAEDEEEAAEYARWLAALPSMTADNLGLELLEAARYGEVREVSALLFANAPVDFTDTGGNTALHRACANGHIEVIRLLARAGASLVQNESGNLPLHWAVQQGDARLVTALLDEFPDADVLAKNSFGKSVTTEAFARNVPEIVDAVLAHSSASKLDPEENPSTADALTAHVTHALYFGGVGTDGEPLAAGDTGGGPLAGKDTGREDGGGASADGGNGPSLPSIFTPLHCREINSIGGDDPSAVIGASANEDRTGLQIWSASLVLARWISDDLAPHLRGRSALELGAGCGLPSIAAAIHAGAHSVVATDLAAPTIDNLEHNLQLNGLAPPLFRASVLDWADRSTWPPPLPVLLGSDLVYSREAVPQLLVLLPALLAPGGVFFYVAPETNRLGEAEFLDGMAGLGFARSEAPVPPRYLANVLGEATDEDFNSIFPELRARTYTLYTFFRGGEAIPDEAGGGALVGCAVAGAGTVACEGNGEGANDVGGVALRAGDDQPWGVSEPSGTCAATAHPLSPEAERDGPGAAGGGRGGGEAPVGTAPVSVQLIAVAVGAWRVRVRVRAC